MSKSQNVLPLRGKSEATFLATCFEAHKKQFPRQNLPSDSQTFFKTLFFETCIILEDSVCDSVEKFLVQNEEWTTANTILFASAPKQVRENLQANHVYLWNKPDFIGSTIAKILVLLHSHQVTRNVIHELCTKLPPLRKFSKKNKASVLEPVDKPMVSKVISDLINSNVIVESQGHLYLNESIRQAMQEQLLNSKDHFIQWFLSTFQCLIDKLPRIWSSFLPCLLDNLMSFTKDESVLKFMFHVHETRLNVPVTSMYIYLLAKQKPEGPGDPRNRKDVTSKLKPFVELSAAAVQDDPIAELYHVAASQDIKKYASFGEWKDINYFNFDVTQPTQHFKSQLPTLRELDSKIVPDINEDERSPIILIIHGLPGSGKTTLLKNFILGKLSKDQGSTPFRNLIWLDAQSADALELQLQQMCSALLLHDSDPAASVGTEDLIRLIYNHLLAQPTWIVLDNAKADKLGSCTAADFIPQSYTSLTAPVVFIVTRNANHWLHTVEEHGARFLQVSRFERETSIEYIRARLGDTATNGLQDSQPLVDLAMHFDDFPLALKLACDVINEEKTQLPSGEKAAFTVEQFLQSLQHVQLHDPVNTPAKKFNTRLQQHWFNRNTLEEHSDRQTCLAILDVLALMASPVPALWIYEVLKLENKMKQRDLCYFQQLLSYLQLCSLIDLDSDQRICTSRLINSWRIVQLTENPCALEEAVKTISLIFRIKASSHCDQVKSFLFDMKTSLERFGLDVGNHMVNLSPVIYGPLSTAAGFEQSEVLLDVARQYQSSVPTEEIEKIMNFADTLTDRLCLKLVVGLLEMKEKKNFEEVAFECRRQKNFLTSELVTAVLESDYLQRVTRTISGKPLSKRALKAEHVTAKAHLQEFLLPVLDNIPVLNDNAKDFIKASVDQFVELRFERIKEQNIQDWTQVAEEFAKLSSELVSEYKQEIEQQTSGSASEDQFCRVEKRIRSKIFRSFNQQLKARNPDVDFLVRKQMAFLDLLEARRAHHYSPFEIRHQTARKKEVPDAERTLVKVRNFYLDLLTWPWSRPSAPNRLQQKLEQIFVAAKEEIYRPPPEIQQQECKLVIALHHLDLQQRNVTLRHCPISEPVIGIDLGITSSRVGVFFNNKVQILRGDNAEEPNVPSFVSFAEDGSIEVGRAAEQTAHWNPISTVFDVKRLIGRPFHDVQKEVESWPFQVVEFQDAPRILIGEKKYSAEEITSKILIKMKSLAQQFFGHKITKAVVTVPTYFNNAQRSATKDAAELAGLQATLINESTAAAVCYELHRTGADEDRNVLIFAMGGGSLDVAIITAFRYQNNFQVRATGGDTHLGGRDFDLNMVHAIVERVKRKYSIDLARNANSDNEQERVPALARIERLRTACERAKRVLSKSSTTTLCVPNIDGDFDLKEEITREEFNEINGKLFEKCIKIVQATLQEASTRGSKFEVDEVVLVGGSTQIPKIQQLLRDFYDGDVIPRLIINVDEANVYGAVYHAAIMYGGLEHKSTRRLALDPEEAAKRENFLRWKGQINV